MGSRRDLFLVSVGSSVSWFGNSLALIVDEFALLLDLKDVYWAKQGRSSVDLGVGGIALAGSYFAALPLLRAVRASRRDKRNRHGRGLPSAD